MKAGLFGLGVLSCLIVMVAVLTLGGLDEPDEGATSVVQENGQGAMQEYLDSIVEPLAQAALDHGHERSEFVPSDAEIGSVISSGSLESPEGQVVMARLRESYDFFMMRFPGPPQNIDAATATEVSDRIDATDRAAALYPWFRLRIEQLERAAAAQGIDSAMWIPTSDAVDRAAASGTLDSEESRGVIAQLRRGYLQLGLELPLPR